MAAGMASGWSPVAGYSMWMDPEATKEKVEDAGSTYSLCGLKMFKVFRDATAATDGWEEKFKNPKTAVYQKAATPGQPGDGVYIYKVVNTFPNCDAQTMYDALHDPDFRKTWDENMIAGYNITQLDPRNDIGYYSAKFPWPLSPRDFLNQRMWMEFTNGEYIIMNHTVTHRDAPNDKKYVRGISYMTGYYILPLPDSDTGIKLVYMSHSDPQGSIPQWVLNSAFSKMIPGMMEKLEKNCENYVQWSAENHPAGYVAPWMTPKVDWKGPESPNALASPTNIPVSLTGVAAEGADDAKARGFGDDVPPSIGDDEAAAALEAADPAQVRALQTQLDDLKRQLFLANCKAGSEYSLAPVAPRKGDTKAVAQFRSLMQDACNFADRQFIVEGKVPSLQEYLTRLRGVLEGIRRTTPV